MRQYIRELVTGKEPWFDPEFMDPDHVMTVAEWFQEKNVSLGNYDGDGYWVKDGLACDDEVFSSDPEDATHVVWYNK